MSAPSSESAPPNPLPLASVSPPPGTKGGEAHSAVGEWVGESQFLRLKKSSALCLLCDAELHSRSRRSNQLIHARGMEGSVVRLACVLVREYCYKGKFSRGLTRFNTQMELSLVKWDAMSSTPQRDSFSNSAWEQTPPGSDHLRVFMKLGTPTGLCEKQKNPKYFLSP